MYGVKKSIFTAKEMAQLYQEKPGVWLLLEVLERDTHGRAKKLKLLQFAKEKDRLHDYLMEQKDWNWGKDYIFVFSNPDVQCDLL